MVGVLLQPDKKCQAMFIYASVLLADVPGLMWTKLNQFWEDLFSFYNDSNATQLQRTQEEHYTISIGKQSANVIWNPTFLQHMVI